MSYVRGDASGSLRTRIKETNESFATHLPSIQAASRALQNDLEIYNDEPWPHPISPPKGTFEPGLVEVNGRLIRRALDDCRIYQLDMQRSSQNHEYVDMYIISTDVLEAHQHDAEKHIAWENAGSQLDQGFAGHIRNETSTTANKAKDVANGHQGANANIPTSLEPNTSRSRGSTSNIKNLVILCQPVPQPENMLNTFTHALCEYPNVEASPVLSMTLRDTTPLMQSPTTHRKNILLHLEVGLDGVDALCQGRIRIPESSGWKKNIRERRSGRTGVSKSGDGGFSAEIEHKLQKRGYGQGWWFFFGIRFVATELDRTAGKGGRWVCFGSPFEACTWSAGIQEVVYLGGGKDATGGIVPRSRTTTERFNTRFSIGGTTCIDLFDGAEQWRSGVWKNVREAMAHDSLLVSFLCTNGKPVMSKKRPFKREDTSDDASGV